MTRKNEKKVYRLTHELLKTEMKKPWNWLLEQQSKEVAGNEENDLLEHKWSLFLEDGGGEWKYLTLIEGSRLFLPSINFVCGFQSKKSTTCKVLIPGSHDTSLLCIPIPISLRFFPTHFPWLLPAVLKVDEKVLTTKKCTTLSTFKETTTFLSD